MSERILRGFLHTDVNQCIFAVPSSKQGDGLEDEKVWGFIHSTGHMQKCTWAIWACQSTSGHQAVMGNPDT